MEVEHHEVNSWPQYFLEQLVFTPLDRLRRVLRLLNMKLTPPPGDSREER